MMANGLAYASGAWNGSPNTSAPSWFYTAYRRGDEDPLTNYTLAWVERNISKDGRVLNTGCGTGIMLFHLIDKGFKHVEGFDYLHEAVEVTQHVAKLGGYNAKVWQDDGFRPQLSGEYDLILALHWVFSAWMGNYGNNPAADPRSPEVREQLLDQFISSYASHLKSGGRLIVELTDAVADYRVEGDGGPKGLVLQDIYPVRQSPEQVARIAAKHGLEVEDCKMCCRYGHQPRTSYILRKV